MKNLTIGQLAKETGVNLETIRYYERRGLIAEPPRRESGYREFPRTYVEDAVYRLRHLILQAYLSLDISVKILTIKRNIFRSFCSTHLFSAKFSPKNTFC